MTDAGVMAREKLVTAEIAAALRVTANPHLGSQGKLNTGRGPLAHLQMIAPHRRAEPTSGALRNQVCRVRARCVQNAAHAEARLPTRSPAGVRPAGKKPGRFSPSRRSWVDIAWRRQRAQTDLPAGTPSASPSRAVLALHTRPQASDKSRRLPRTGFKYSEQARSGVHPLRRPARCSITNSWSRKRPASPCRRLQLGRNETLAAVPAVA